MSFKILVVDNEADDLAVTKSILATDPEFETVSFLDSDEAIAYVRQFSQSIACVLLDYHMPKDGLTTAQEMFVINPDLSIAILSADQTREALKKSISIGIHSFIDKDEDNTTLLGVVRSLCQKWKNKAEYLSDQSSVQIEDEQKYISSFGLIGKSQKLVDTCKIIDRASQSDCNVMILGESGSGKELIAKAIHYKSKRKDKPFVAINVTAITENLIESELFGHTKGSFTGANEDKIGKLQLAQGGTLFLDEIGDLKPEAQVKLLRVLQEKKVTPVGSHKVINLDIRIITATHVNLEKAIREGKFREDLYYRLLVFPILNPPLRDRVEDIQPLIQHFLKKYNNEQSQPKFLMSTVSLLQRYSWFGNVRELENEIQRLIALGYSVVEPKHLSPKFLSGSEYEQAKTPTLHEFQKIQWEKELDYLEKHIKNSGSMREAARTIFQASPSSIHTRMTNLKEYIKKSSLNSLQSEQGGLSYE